MWLHRFDVILQSMGPFKCYVTQMGVGRCLIFQKKALRRCKVQCYLRYEGVGGGPISRKKRYVTLEWPLSCLGTIICYLNTIRIVPVYACKVCDALVASCATDWLASMRQNGRPTLKLKRESDVAQSYTSSVLRLMSCLMMKPDQS